MKDHARLPIAAFASLPLFASLGFAQSKPAGVTYAKVETVFKANCIGCHQGATPSGGVNLSSYEKVTKGQFKGRPLVTPKSLDKSVLALSLHGKGVMKMPPGGKIADSDAKTIEAWIISGAKR